MKETEKNMNMLLQLQQIKLDCVTLATSIMERREPDKTKTPMEDANLILEMATRYFKFITEN